MSSTLGRRRAIIRRLIFLLVLAACSNGDPVIPDTPGDSVPVPAGVDTAKIPLTALGTQTYRGFAGGLYPNGTNEPPSDHAAVGRARAAAIRPLDGAGTPSPTGRYVMLSIGMSNTTQEFCGGSASTNCRTWTFMGKAATDARVNHTTLAIVDGAAGGQTTVTWDSPADANYNRVRDQILTPRGLTEAQVQIVWLKLANPQPTVSLPNANADAYVLERGSGDVYRALMQRYPNLRQVFLSSRIYAGYATTTLNPEPYAYETGFATKWLIEAQITQRRTGAVDERAGDLAPASGAWLAWSAYLWGRGATPRSDGLTWLPADLQSDGTHPSQSGQTKVADLLMEFFTTSQFTSCWFLAGQTCVP